MNWIITICRNCLPLTRNCLPTLLNQDIGDVQVLVVNNASTDGTAGYLRHLRWTGNPITVISFEEQRSVAACWNAALQITLAESEYALVVNSDTELRSDTYRHLVADGGQFVTGVGVSSREQVGEPRTPKPEAQRNHPDFSNYLIRRDCWKKVPFDEHYIGAYGEDAQQHINMHRAGIRAYCLDLPFYHVASGTVKSASPEEVRKIQRNADANRALFKQRYGVEIGSPGYYAMFSEETFGVDRATAERAGS